jgi:hypothetical protein
MVIFMVFMGLAKEPCHRIDRIDRNHASLHYVKDIFEGMHHYIEVFDGVDGETPSLWSGHTVFCIMLVNLALEVRYW